MHLRKTDKTTHQSTLMLWEGNRQIQEYTDDFVFTTVYDEGGFEPVARVVQVRNPKQDNGQGNGNDEVELFKIYHYHNNHLGTPQELTDDCGEVVWCNYEWAWGGSYQSYYKEQSLNNISIDKNHLQPLKFQGQFFDSETSLHYNRFRYYDSDVGMFIQRDPIGLLGGINIFQYADNPIMWIDPFGLSSSITDVIATATINNTTKIGRSRGGNGTHAELNAVMQFSDDIIQDADIWITSITAFDKESNTRRPVQVCASCRYDLVKFALDKGAKSLNIEMKPNVFYKIPSSDFSKLLPSLLDAKNMPFNSIDEARIRSSKSFNVLSEYCK